jgi:hypothetical protein
MVAPPSSTSQPFAAAQEALEGHGRAHRLRHERVYDLAAELDWTLTQPLHRQLAKENPGVIPSPSVIDRHLKAQGEIAEWVRDEAKRRVGHVSFLTARGSTALRQRRRKDAGGRALEVVRELVKESSCRTRTWST